MDIPEALNKSRSELEQMHHDDLVELLLDSNAFIMQHLLNENTMLKEQMRILVSSASAQTQCIDDLTDRIGSLETELWKKDVSARQMSVNQGAMDRNRAQSMDTGMMQKRRQQQQQQQMQQQQRQQQQYQQQQQQRGGQKSVGFRGIPEQY